MKKIFYLFITLLISHQVLAIDSINWIGGVSDDWTNPANWSAGRLPVASELVNINASSQRNLVIYNGTSITVTAIVLENTDKSLIINSGATLTGTANHSYMIYLGQGTSLTNNGTINYTTTGRSTEVPFHGLGTFASNFINNGTINVNSNDAVFGINTGASMNITNNGTINITKAKYCFYGQTNLTNNGTVEFTTSFNDSFVFTGILATVINNACGKFIARAGLFESKATTNAGYMQVSGLLKAATGQTITNTGVLIYGSIDTSQLNNTGNSAVIVNNKAYNSSVFSFGGTFNGTIGIYTDMAATNLAGTLNASNVFVPSPLLAAGDLTLYAKIIPSGGACEYIVPFTYNKDSEIDIKGNRVTIIDGDIGTSPSNDTEFGSQSVFSGTIAKTFTIYNKGNSPLNLTGTSKVSLTGTNPSDFTVTTQPASPIAENDSTTFQITFDPSAGGSRLAQVNIDNDDSNENPYNFRIRGIGTCDGPTGVSVNNTVVCNGESISLTATCTTGTITWYNQSGGGTAIGTGSPFSYTPTSSRSYYATCNYGICESSRTSTSQVNILASGNTPTGVSVDRTTICLGGSVVLSATCALGTITWYNQATGGTAIGTGTSLNQSPTVNSIYYVACNNTNCESNRIATSQVIIGSNPTASISYPATSYHITEGAANVILTGTSGGTFTSGPAGLSINSSSGLIMPNSSTTGTYTVTYTVAASGGCTSATATTSVTITSVPIVTLTSNNNPASIGANVQLTATIIPTTATGTITFKDGSTTIGTATLSSGVGRFNTSLLAVGMHNVTAEYGGDGSNAASTSSAVSEVVNALTEPNLSFITQSAGSSGTSESVGTGVVVDASGNVYKTGYFKGTVTFGSTTLASAGAYDIFIVKYNTSGVVQWAKRAGGTFDDRGNGIAVSGTDIYVTGQFMTTANFNTPSASGSNELVSAGSTDIFVAKYNDSGTVEWIKRGGGSIADVGNGITVLGTDVYVTGGFGLTANFNTPSATGSNQLTSAGLTDIFLAKYNSSGDVQWLKRAGGANIDTGKGIAVSGTDIYIIGEFVSTVNFNNPSATGTNEITSSGSSDIFIAKYTNAGAFQWAKRVGGTDIDTGNGIAASATGVYITGFFYSNSINFNTPSASGSNEVTSLGGSDIFIARYNSSGDLQWAKRAGSAFDDIGFGVCVSGTSIYMAGRFSSTANFNSPSATGSNQITSNGSNSDVFVAKYNEDSDFLWAIRAGGSDTDQCLGITASGSNIYFTGNFPGTANFNNPSATGSNQLTAVGATESFLAKYTDSGTLTTTTTLTSNNNPASVGANVQLTATLTPSAATGTVTFKEGSTILGTATLSGGIAKFNTSLLTVGTHSITAEYGGDGSNAASTSGAVSQVINALTEPKLSFLRQVVSTVQVVNNATTTDASGNVYVIGSFSGVLTIGNTTLTSGGDFDIYIAKYNASGELQWAKRAGGTSIDRGVSIAITGNDIYITGSFRETMNFNNPSAGGSNEIISAGDEDSFVAKYDSDGNFAWARRGGASSGSIIPYGVSASGTGVYMAGVFTGTVNFNTPSATGTNEIVCVGVTDIFIVKYNSSGVLQWLKRAGGTEADNLSGIVATDTDLYITGTFAGTPNFNTPSDSGSNTITATSSVDSYIAKYNLSGDIQWIRRADGTLITAITTTGTDLYITGANTGTAHFYTASNTVAGEIPADGGDIFIGKYNNAGDILWLKRAGGNTNWDIAYGITTSGTNVYITGKFQETANFNTPSTSGSNEVTSAGADDAFIAKYHSSGNFIWAKRAGGNSYDLSKNIALSGNNLYIVGQFFGSMDFNNPSATGANELIATSGYNNFLVKYDDTTLATTTTLTSNNNPASVGANVQLTATVTPSAATGIVTFKEGSTVLGTATLSSGVAKFNTSLLMIGTHTITAYYNGDVSNDGSTSNTISQGINALTNPKLSFIRQSAGFSSGDAANAKAIAVDASGNIYKTGYFTGTVTFEGVTLVSAGAKDIFIVKYDASGTVLWAKRAGGTSEDIGYGVSVSSSGLFITGQFESTANFNTPSASGSNELTSAGVQDIFVAKYNTSGDLQWIRRSGGTNRDLGYALAVSGTDVLITGVFNGTANFNTPSSSGTNTLASAGASDMFLAKFNDSGDFQWARRGGGALSDFGGGYIVASGTDIYISGAFLGTANFNTPSATGSNEITSAGSADIFITKYTASGDFLWARRAGSVSGNENGNALSVYNDEVYMTGMFYGTANFNTPSAFGSNELISEGSGDIFIAKYSSSGNVLWLRRGGGTQDDDFGNCIAVSSEGVFVTGSVRGIANFNTPSASGSNTIDSRPGANRFIARYNHSGDLSVAQRLSQGNNASTTAIGYTSGHLIIGGDYLSNIDFNPVRTSGSNELVLTGDELSFLIKIDVSRTSSSIVLASNNNPAISGANVQFTATVSPGTATGTVTFKDGTTTLGTTTLSGGVATFTTNTLTSGTHTITAEYAGDGTYEASVSNTLSQVINCVNPTDVSVSNTNICNGSGISLTANCTSGVVTWYSQLTGGSSIGTGSGLTQNPAVNTTYYVTCKDISCESARIATNQVTVSTPSAPNITAPNPKVVCAPSTLTLTASGCAGTVNWSNGSSGTSLTLSSVGTYSISATCTVGGCMSVASAAVIGLQIVNQPSAPTITAPNPKVVCVPNTLTLTASDCTGTVNWSTGSTGTSLTLSSVGTYSITATCTVGSCTSPASTAVTDLEIVNQPSAPTITAPNPKVVCTSGTLTLTASGCAGTVNWSTGSTGTSVVLSSVGTYSITATCTVGSCTSPASTAVTGLEVVNQPSAPTITAPNPKVVCAPGTLTLTASGCAGTVNWSTGASGTSVVLSSVGTYSITANCTVGSCISPASTSVTGLQIVAQPTAPTITAPASKLVCSPSTLTLTASGCAGTVNWSNGSSGTSLTLSSVGTYSITATCTVGSCISPASTSVTGLQIVAQPTAPTITAPASKLVCSPSTLTLTASGCAGTVNWSNGSSGTSLTLSSVGTYSITATCTVGSCISPASTSVTGLQIVAQPTAPTITAPASKLVCSPSTLTLTASGCAGTVNWSNGSSGTSLTLSSVGTYSITATCTVGSCISPASTSVTGLQIVAQPTAPTITAPASKLVCSPSTLTLTASGCAGTVNWSNGSSGTSLTLSSVGTYSITATCTVGSCISPASTSVTGLQIVAQPTAPTITAPASKLVCSPSTLTLTASGCAGTVNWSNGSSGTSLTLS
ncbi:Ig-like domain repeat protein, partial [Emticicia agri]